MRCPDCNKEVGSSAYCPYCGATIDNRPKEETVNSNITKSAINNSVKPLFFSSLISFGVASICILLWYFICSRLFWSFMGNTASVAFTYAFSSKIIIILVLGLATSVILAFSNRIPNVSQKLVCSIVCIVFAIFSFAILSFVGANSNDISPEAYQYAIISKRTLNIFLSVCIPLLIGSIFISFSGNKKLFRIPLSSLLIVIAFFLLSFSLIYIGVCVLCVGVVSILYSTIAPVVIFILTLTLLRGK